MKRSIVMSVSVCAPARDHIFETTRPIFTTFFVHFTMALTRSSSGIVIVMYFRFYG